MVLVMGASGYIGSALLDALQELYAVRVGLSRCDQMVPAEFKGVDVVINAAGAAHGRGNARLPEDLAVNSRFPAQVLEEAQKQGVEYVIHLSSISVFSPWIAKIDEYSTHSGVGVYGESKLLGEKNLLRVSKECTRLMILRLPMVYGVNAPGNPRKLVQLCKFIKVLPLGGIKNARSFIAIRNVTVAIEQALESRCSGTFCIADDFPVSTSQLIKHLAALHDISVTLFHLPFLQTLMRVVPSVYRSLYTDLKIDNQPFKRATNIMLELPPLADAQSDL